MSKRRNGEPERSEVNVHDAEERSFWTARLACTETELRHAVAAVGTDPSHVAAWLRARRKK